MKKLTAIAALPLCAGLMFAQSQSQSAQRETKTETTTTTQSSTWNGTLVDASCRMTHSAHRESTETSKVDENTTKTTKTTSTENRMECPITASTATFGLMTADGKYIPFDETSNAKVSAAMRSNDQWSKSIQDKKPVSVTVVGNNKGDTIVIESIK